MVRKIFFRILCIGIVVLLTFSNSVSAAKTYHFKAFASPSAINVDEEDDEDDFYSTATIGYMVSAMQTLEYNNYYGTNNYHITSSKQDVLDYIGMSGKNYGLAVLAHGNTTYFTMGDSSQRITVDNITGTWHLVLINSCYTYQNNSFANAFKTVGYDHRASIGFYSEVTYKQAHKFWEIFASLAGSTTLDTIVHYADDMTDAPGVLWGDGTWNGYAWY